MQFTYHELNRPQLRQALTALMDTDKKFRFKVAGQVSDLFRTVIKELENSRVAYVALGDQFAKRDETGKPVVDPDGQFAIDPEKSEEFQKAFDKFLMTPFKVRWGKIPAKDLEGVKLRPIELFALEPFLDGLDKLDDLEEILGPVPDDSEHTPSLSP